MIATLAGATKADTVGVGAVGVTVTVTGLDIRPLDWVVLWVDMNRASIAGYGEADLPFGSYGWLTQDGQDQRSSINRWTVATWSGVSDETLRKYYSQELRMGHIKANSQIAQSLFKKATSDGSQSVTAAIFWAKTRMGWRETSNLDLSGGIKVEIVRFSDARNDTPST